jgi:hypothetical protein
VVHTIIFCFLHGYVIFIQVEKGVKIVLVVVTAGSTVALIHNSVLTVACPSSVYPCPPMAEDYVKKLFPNHVGWSILG